MSRKKKDVRPFWAGDCETDSFRHNRVPKPFIWGLYTGAAYYTFDTVEEFVDFIKDCDVIIYFHNGGRFDLHFLLQHINLYEEVKVIAGRLVVAHIGKCELRDSWNIIPIPLATYKKDEFDYTLLEEKVRHLHMPIIRQYLKNDCVYLYELIEEGERQYGRHLTQAGAAMAQWRKISGKKTPETGREYFQHMAKFYYGGRVQCFQKGRIEGPVEMLDIRSAYPDAMLSPHPYNPEYIITEEPNDYKPTSMVTVECVASGSLPFRDERGSITFPDDNERRRFYVPGHELIAATETGSVHNVDIIQSIDFTDLVDFSPYILHFYNLRKEARLGGHKAIDIFCKLLMNSLYGKFGANPDNYGNFMCVPFQVFEDYEVDGYGFDGMIGPHALMRAPLDEWQSHFINVATAASITSQVRAKLWRALKQCVDPIYCDTDSIFCRAFNVELGEELGQWNHEGTASRVYIAGKKMYLCEGKFGKDGKHKQATKGAKLTPQQIRRLCQGETVTYKPEVPTFSLHKKPVFTDRRIRMT